MKIVISLALMFTVFGCTEHAAIDSKLIGTTMPTFKLLLSDSATYFDTKDIPKGKSNVLFYFGPYCPYCRAQMTDILDNMAKLKDINFYIFTTSTFSQMKEFYTYHKLANYPNIKVGIDYANFFPNYYEVKGVPFIVVYGKNKNVRGSWTGNISVGKIREVSID